MIKARIIPILLLRNKRMVKGTEFSQYRDVGDPVSVVRIYNAQNVDELVFLDIDATAEGRLADVSVIKEASKEAFLPMTIGGGVRTVSDVEKLLKAGADKVALNTMATENLSVVQEAAEVFGKQCIIVSIDVRQDSYGKYIVYSQSGKKNTGVELDEYLKKVCDASAGEVLINSIDRDGKMIGYDHSLIQLCQQQTNLPVIIAGGSGSLEQLYHAIKETNVSGVGCGSVFYFADNNPIRARSYFKQKGLPVRKV